MEDVELTEIINVCGCFHFDAAKKESSFRSCKYCDYAEPNLIVGWICGHVKYKGGNIEKEKTKKDLKKEDQERS